MHLSSCRGQTVLSVIETKFLHLLNIMKLAPYSVDYVSLRHPEMCSCSKHNTQFVQHLFISERIIYASSMLVYVGCQAEKWSRFLCSIFTYVCRECSQSGYQQVHPPPSHGAFWSGEGVGCRMPRGSSMGTGGAGCPGGLPWKEGVQDNQEGQPPRSGLQTQSGVLSQQTVAHRPDLILRAARGTARPGHVHFVYGCFYSGSQVVWRDKKAHKMKTLDINWGRMMTPALKPAWELLQSKQHC